MELRPKFIRPRASKIKREVRVVSALRKPNLLWTKEEYWAFEEGSVTKHEYFEGEVYAMAGAKPRHNDIAMNIARVLSTQLVGKPCRVRGSDQRLEIEETGLETYPDISILSPPFRYNPQQTMNSFDATVIVEVLSRRTRDYDRNQKFRNYHNLPSFRHYLLIEQDRVEIEHRFLQEGKWQSETFSGLNDTIKLAAVACQLKLADVYADIDFEAEN
jgi:Uma2 family endonuclease